MAKANVTEDNEMGFEETPPAPEPRRRKQAQPALAAPAVEPVPAGPMSPSEEFGNDMPKLFALVRQLSNTPEPAGRRDRYIFRSRLERLKIHIRDLQQGLPILSQDANVMAQQDIAREGRRDRVAAELKRLLGSK